MFRAGRLNPYHKMCLKIISHTWEVPGIGFNFSAVGQYPQISGDPEANSIESELASFLESTVITKLWCLDVVMIMSEECDNDVCIGD